MDREYYLEKLLFILEHKLNVRKDLLVEENYDVILTGRVFRLTAIELLYLFLEVEQEVGFPVNTELLEQYPFNSVNGIADLMAFSNFQKKMEAQ